jgi:hypothetical protein
MNSVKNDAEGAVNQFITDQKAVPGEATLTLVQFDGLHGGGEEWYQVLHDGDIKLAPAYELHPRGNTALLDATGRAITATGEKLAALPEHERPDKVIFVVQTDGQENASSDWTVESLREAIKRQTDEYGWQFVFLGMGPDTFQQGHNLGFQNVTRSAQAPAAYAATYDNVSRSASAFRGGTAANMAGTNAEVDEHGNVTS